MIAIIDYDAGNLKSVEKALQHLGEECKVTRDAREIMEAELVLLVMQWKNWSILVLWK